MYVRDAKNRDEAWLLDYIEEMGLDERSFRSRDYVIAVDEGSNTRAGFGRLRIHKTDDGDFVELTGIGVLESWRGQGVGAHVVERLVEKAGDEEFEAVYCFTPTASYLEQFGFEPLDEDVPEALADRLDQVRADEGEDATAMRLDREAFVLPERFRERFKNASPDGSAAEPEVKETAEDFGIDPEQATYKYDTGG
ncbi:GNAT family N-acetyltransferase [Halobaculum gomorrense]|uniref:N-acetylglutamate synthase, GNAT family n=1 Tax=Halobaculum gomorrense TaxID=43928 RepID=A0A1M5UM97_9EURY|nr:GNAT family N-acetyltransferase [Halobaculum gomorrense]SHH64125.1 N-acetylglutamate synthase, GNAT family [Halobaculum gomorrense]